MKTSSAMLLTWRLTDGTSEACQLELCTSNRPASETPRRPVAEAESDGTEALTILLDSQLERRVVIGRLLDLERSENARPGRVSFGGSTRVNVLVNIEDSGRRALPDEW